MLLDAGVSTGTARLYRSANCNSTACRAPARGGRLKCGDKGLKLDSQSIPDGFPILDLLRFQVWKSPEEEIGQGHDPDHNDHRVRNDAQLPQERNERTFEEARIPGDQSPSL